MADVTRILSQIELGDPAAADQLLPLVYAELRKVAAWKLQQERPGQTLQATALVHEAYVRLVDQSTPQKWDNRKHFLGAAAEAMRRILVERARQRKSLKQGGNRNRVDLDEIELGEVELSHAAPGIWPLACDDLLGLDDALAKLELQHPRKAALTKLRFFTGLTVAEAAAVLEVSVATAENDWAYARSWLRLEMEGNGDRPDNS